MLQTMSSNDTDAANPTASSRELVDTTKLFYSAEVYQMSRIVVASFLGNSGVA